MKKIRLFIFLGVVFWFNAAMIIRFLGANVFSAGSPKLVLMFLLAIPVTVVSIYITKVASGFQYHELLRPMVVMTFIATFCDGIAMTWFRSLYSDSFEVAFYGAALILWGVGIGLLMAFYLELRHTNNPN